jgi:M6 family metalloprotease-like protein
MAKAGKSVVLLIIAIMAIVFVASTHANPVGNRVRTFTQPDGVKFEGVLKGDEHFIFGETTDGYSIIKDPTTNYYTYAQLKDGLLVPTNYIVGKSTPPYPQHLRPNAQAVADLPRNADKVINWSADKHTKMATEFLYGVGGTKENPTKAPAGRQYVNTLLSDFSDSTFAFYSNLERNGQNPYTSTAPFPYDHTSPYDDNAANSNWFNFLILGDSIAPYNPDSSCVGSLSNFYFDMTYKKVWWYGVVDGPRNTNVAKASAVSGGYATSTYQNACISTADPYVDFDTNNDAVADGLIIIHPGHDEQTTGSSSDIASYSGSVSISTSDGVTIREIIFCPQAGQLGVMCHELFHQLGGWDLYDYGYSANPWGYWSLMDYGSLAGVLYGDQPTFAGSHCQLDIDMVLTNGFDGWLTQTDSISSLRNGDGRYTIAALDSCGQARAGTITTGVRLWRIRNNAFRDSAQVWFVENRRRIPPYESGLPESGLIITHIDTRMGTGSRFNDGPPCTRAYYSWVESPGFDPNLRYEASDTGDYNRQDAIAAYSANDYSPGGYPQDRIDSTSVPNSWINQCYTTTPNRTGPFIYDISAEGPYMSFSVARTGLVPAVPIIGYVSNVIKDPILAGTANNNNFIVDPWETDSLIIRFSNYGGASITSNARCSLYIANYPQYITINNSGWLQVGTGTLNINTEANALPFVLGISKDAPRFTDILFAAVFKGTYASGTVTDTSYFNLRISNLNVVQAYDFQNIRVGGTTFPYHIQPTDLAIYRDTLFIGNSSTSGTFTRIYKVKKNTTNNPLVGGTGGDTISSLNNFANTHISGKYVGGIDVDNSGRLWYSLADSACCTNRSTTMIENFAFPNCSWAGTNGSDYLRRVRGIAWGPAIKDTVGPDFPMAGIGDSLWAYWQYYTVFDESLYVIKRSAGGTGSVAYAYSFDDSIWGAGYGGDWWNGRALENDGSSIWTSCLWLNYLIRRNPIDCSIIEIMPAPSTTGAYGTYGMAVEAVNSSGVSYAPVGTLAYVPGAYGNKHYLYCASMDEGKIYKLDISNFVIPTPPDSTKTEVSGSDNIIKWWKTNVDDQKIYQYIVYRQAPGTTTAPTSSDELTRVTHTYGTGIYNQYVDVGAGTKVDYVYTIKSVNYYGEGAWGASVSAPLKPPEAVELTSFTYTLSGNNNVTLNWVTASEVDNTGWIIERSTDNENYIEIGKIAVDGPNQYGAKYSYSDAPSSSGLYYYRIADIALNGYKTYYGPLPVHVGKPLVYSLSQNYPNPMSNTGTSIMYGLKESGKTSLKIYNLLGEEVKTLVDEVQLPNTYVKTWDGKDNKGQNVANGVYFYKLTSGSFSDTKKLTVLK